MSDLTKEMIDLMTDWKNGQKEKVAEAVKEMTPSDAFTFGTYFGASFDEPEKTMQTITMYSILM